VATNNAVNNGLSGATGSGSFVGSISPTLVTPTIGAAIASSVQFASGNGILDNNSNNVLTFTTTGSAVNYANIVNSSTGNPVLLKAIGTDSNISLNLNSKGSGSVNLLSNGTINLASFTLTSTSSVNYPSFTASTTTNPVAIVAAGSDTNILLQLQGTGNAGVGIQGTAAAGNATSGYVGEVVSSAIVSASAVNSGGNNTPTDMTSISLTAGDWNVWGNIAFQNSGIATQYNAWISTSSATAPDLSLRNILSVGGTALGVSGLIVPMVRINVSTTTTVYISFQAAFSTGAVTACGNILARRVR
jgi:hypothetical protein